jgi:dephospho-CoA kinase
VLRIGLTGGIGAGKSTVSATLRELGAVVVDGDVIAREVVEPGTPGLASLVDAFGEEILTAEGALNRPVLAKIAFPDDEKRATLNGIVHPLVAQRRSELIAAADDDTGSSTVVIEDIPLLVESQMAPLFPLVIVVHADAEVRVRRLIEYRGFSEEDARARIAAQATEEQRRAVADVWLDNAGDADDLVAAARRLWHDRIEPFAANLAAGRPAAEPSEIVAADPEWPAQGQRIVARVRTACGHRAARVEHVGPTAEAGRAARDVIDIDVTVASSDSAGDLSEPLAGVGYVRTDDDVDTAGYASADPGRPTRLHVRVERPVS